MPHPLFVGIDAGGTKTRLQSSQTPTVFLGPGANLKRLGLSDCVQVLAELIQNALDEAPGHALAGICAGVAGVSTPAAASHRLFP